MPMLAAYIPSPDGRVHGRRSKIAPAARGGFALAALCFAGCEADKEPGDHDFVWDTVRYPALRDIPLGPDGLPTDPTLRPGPAGLPEALSELLGIVEELGPDLRTAPGPARLPDAPGQRPEDGAAPEPPPHMRCPEEPFAGCYQQVPSRTVLRGAQAVNPTAPGYDPDAHANEAPPFYEDVPSFWIQRMELSVGALAACVEHGVCGAVDLSALQPQLRPDRFNAPLRGLTWSEAGALCRFLGGALPTEAQWASAARADDGRRWPARVCHRADLRPVFAPARAQVIRGL